MKLVIVESPTKAKTFNRFIDEHEYKVVSSMGHIRDLPQKKLGIDLEKRYEPEYEVMSSKKALITAMVKDARKAKEIILATDPDREGEAIAYHIKKILMDKVKKLQFSRIVFHEITKDALLDALKEAKDIDLKLFDAQQARRILDRLFGYKLSPYLWKRFAKRWLSAGRVQSVALRFTVEREKERSAFKQTRIYHLRGDFSKKGKSFPVAKLMKLKGKNYYQNQTVTLFDGKYEYQTTLIIKPDKLKKEEKRLLSEKYQIGKVEETLTTRQPPPPFTTSTLQQYASSYLGYSAKRTMRIAQSLYEEGLITYHRTDSNNLSEKFLKQARIFIEEKYGVSFLSGQIRRYKTKSKLAQEAHEAIRPTNLKVYENGSQIDKLQANQAKLYLTIYRRTLATQMQEAKLKNQRILIDSQLLDQFSITNQKIVSPGFLVLYENKNLDSAIIANLESGDEVKLKKLETEEKETQPPPYYNEASLIKTLEAKGIGRPSTYAPIVSLIQERQYVEKRGRDLIPTALGMTTSNLLTRKFDTLMDPLFTAKMEDELDLIAMGERKWQGIVGDFYEPFSKQLELAYKETDKIKVEEKTDKKCPKCHKPLVIKISRFGKFYACSGFPDCKYTESFFESLALKCPKCEKGQVVVRFSKKKRRFYACSRYPSCDFTSLWLPKASQGKTNGEEDQTQHQQ